MKVNRWKLAVKKGIRSAYRPFFKGELPSFLIVGAQKAGTSSLHYYLNKHPQLIGSWPKEVHFFDRDERYSKGLEFYKKEIFNPFKSKKDLGAQYFETTPNYLYSEKAALRIIKDLGQVPIIILLRDPVSRAYSAWNMYRRLYEMGKFRKSRAQIDMDEAQGNYLYKYFYSKDSFPSFEEVIDMELNELMDSPEIIEPSIIRRGIYYTQIKRYFDLFGKNQVLVCGFKDLKKNREEFFRTQISPFLRLKTFAWDEIGHKKRNVVNYIPKMNPSTQSFLENYFEPFNNKLESTLDVSVNR
jgi:hypothetical protein